jgi:hypothetical protein
MIDETVRAFLEGGIDAVREFIVSSLRGIGERIDSLEAKILALPKPERGEKGEKGEPGSSMEGPPGPPGPAGKDAEVDYQNIIKGVIEKISVPKNGADGKDGKDAVVDYERIIEEVLKKIPIPKDGKDATVDYSIIISESIKQIPIPQNGRDGRDGANGRDAIVDYERIYSEVVNRIPTPKDGKDGADAVVDYPLIISETIKQIPVPRDGKDGKDAIVDYGHIVEEVLKRIPVPKDGKDGESIVGPPGLNGRDALQVDILPSIDLTRSYPRGTFALYDNGIVRSYRNTLPGEAFDKSGWEVVVPGVADITMDRADDLRTFMFGFRKTGGELKQAIFSMPVMIYRGIFKMGDQYDIGDVVTWGGSAWHSQVNNNKSEPGKNDDWKLMVKEGRKGKDGKDGEQGPQGPPGRPGMDKL